MKNIYENVAMSICPICGKEFYIPNVDDWYWTIRNRLLCSYGCLRKVEKGEVELEYNHRRPLKCKPLYMDIYNLRKQGKTYNEIKKLLHISEGTVGVALQVLRKNGLT